MTIRDVPDIRHSTYAAGQGAATSPLDYLQAAARGQAMMLTPVDPITAMGVTGPEWNIAIPDAPAGVDGAAPVDGEGSFGGMLGKQLEALQNLQTDAAAQSTALATGTAEDASQVVMAVEKARLSMQLAASLRDKGVESFQEIFRTQV